MTDGFREFLYRTWRLAESLTQLSEDWAVLDSSCKSMTANYNKVGSSGGGSSAKDTMLATRADLSAKLERYRRQLADTETEILRFLERLKTRNPKYGERDAAILKYRYVERLEWKDIHRVLQWKDFECGSLRTVFNWHDGAVRRGGELWEEINGCCNERES